MKRASFQLILALLTAVVGVGAQTQYFEPPRAVVTGEARFPRMIARDGELVIAYQEAEFATEEQGELWISLVRSQTGQEWIENARRIGPISFSGARPPLVYSIIDHPDGSLYVATTVSAEETQIHRSTDGGSTFSVVHRVSTAQTNVAPRLAITSDDSVVLFVNQNRDGRQQIVYVRSQTGVAWSDPVPLEPDDEIGLTFLPAHARADGRDYVVYQGLNIGERSTYQLYLRVSEDGGATWGPSRRLTTFGDPTLSPDADLFDNQRPNLALAPSGDELILTWERRFQTGSPQIYLFGLDLDGSPNGTLEEVTGRFDLARSPRIAFDEGELVLVWFTNPQGNSRVVLGRRGGFRWQTTTLSPLIGEATFAEIVSYNGRLHIAWQRRSGESASDLVYVEPDQSVEPPALAGANFRTGSRSANPRAEFAVTDAEDASGIRGYAFAWSRNPNAPVPRELMQRVPDRRIIERADTDGEWYLRVRATDFAGNWSEPATAQFFLDTTPPGPVAFPPPAVDENGFLASNTFQVGWRPPEDEPDLGGYSVRLDYIGPLERIDVTSLNPLPVPERVTTTAQSIGRTNVDNGVWQLTVAAVDAVGNVGEARAIPLLLNKYIPVTRVDNARLASDLVGRLELTVSGRGFTSNGTIRQLVLDRDGVPPYDYEYNAWQNAFDVDSDRQISGLTIADVEAGRYRLGLLHSERGMYLASLPVIVEARGTIKFGDFRDVYDPVVVARQRSILGIETSDVAFWLTIAAATLLILISSVRLVAIGGEIRRLNVEAQALIQGRSREALRAERERTHTMRIQGIGLRLKFTFLVVLVVIGGVVLVAVVLGRNVLERQENILVSGLQERIELLVEGQVTGARPALQNPQLNLDQLQTLANQGEAMAEALYVTISGLSAQGEIQTIFGTTDPAVTSPTAEGGRIDTDTYIVGVSRLTDEVSEEIAALAADLNAQAQAELGEIPVELDRLSQEAQTLILRGAGDEEIERIDQIRNDLLRRGQQRLSEIAGPIRSEPAFDFTELRRDITEYLFYKPVMDIVPGAGAGFEDYYRGTVRVAISTQLIIDEINATQRDLIVTTLAIALAAVAFGVVGAIVLAAIVVSPINRLVALVDTISRAEDKSELKGQPGLTLRSKDELNLLATAINEMMYGLVKAAEADKDLKFGKETQKAFIPLEVISEDAKRTFGELDERGAYFFGYYEGAKGVSGDYFTYQKLSDRYYAMIKCDVAGKGIPAALIMVQVATVFQDYFRGWTPARPGLDVSSFVLRVNDIVAERQFKGRFAALTAGILDVEKGAFYLSNAGDNQLHLFRKAKMEVEQLTIPGGPAAGTFSSDDMPISFPQEMQMINVGDLLLLFTDGLEEAKRLLRGSDWKPIVVTQEMIDRGEVAEGLSVGEDGEEFTNERIHTIISAVQRHGTYTLVKLMDPNGDEPLTFDFSSCENTARDSVLAIVAIERIFRLVPDPSAGDDSHVMVDRIIALFLKEHFDQFDTYFAFPADPDWERSTEQYVEFRRLREDEQFDDITMLVVQRR